MEKSANAPSYRRLVARVRARIRRQRDEVEGEQISGELNLVPFLDILVNTMIFLLATSVVAAPRAAIPVTAPSTDPDVEDNRAGPPAAPLNLTVAISKSGFIVGGSGGILSAPDGTRPTIPCAVALQQGRCPVSLTAASDRWVDRYDYPRLTRMVSKIKRRYPTTRQAVLTADARIPYQVVVRTMDALRGKPTAACAPGDGCLFDRISFAGGIK